MQLLNSIKEREVDKIISVILVAIAGGILLGGLLAAFMALPVWLLWNWVCVDALHLPALTFLQSFGLALLCSLLFKSTTSTKSRE
jgi:hypothetical protein